MVMQHGNTKYSNDGCRCDECRAGNAAYQRKLMDMPGKRKRRNDLVTARRDATIERVRRIKLAAGCTDCGYRKYAVALDFDHLPGEVKLFNISAANARPWPQVEAEIAKCDVVCSNCHRVRTAERRAVVEPA